MTKSKKTWTKPELQSRADLADVTRAKMEVALSVGDVVDDVDNTVYPGTYSTGTPGFEATETPQQ